MTLDERLREIDGLYEKAKQPMSLRADAMQAHTDRVDFASVLLAHWPDILSALRDRGRWIPVGEGLPEDEVSVLIYEPPSKHFAGCGIQKTCRYKGHWIMNHKDDFVTHWMPLPAAPASVPGESGDAEDARRYRWLREPQDHVGVTSEETGEHGYTGHHRYIVREELDTIVDSGLKEVL